MTFTLHHDVEIARARIAAARPPEPDMFATIYQDTEQSQDMFQ